MWSLQGLSNMIDLQNMQQRIAANNAAAATMNSILQKPDHVFDLAITMNYVEPMGFCVNDSIREVVKNALDGALSYARKRLQISDNIACRLESDGNKWNVQPVNLPKLVQQLGFKYGYEARITLVLSGISSTGRQGQGIHWSGDPRAVCQIRACYASREYVDATEIDEENGNSLEDMGLVLYQLVAENYALDFTVNNFIFLGSSLKVASANSRKTLPFGEGLKLAALAALNDGFSLEVTGGGMAYRYEFSPDHNDANAQYLRAVCSRSHLLLADHPDLIQVKLTRQTQWHTEALFSKEHFRSLMLDKSNLVAKGFSGGEILLAPHYAGRLYCRGVFAAECRNLLGIDLDFKLSRDKNKPFDFDALKLAYGKLLLEVLTDASQAQKNVAHQLIERMKGYSKRSLEAEVITCEICDPVGITAKALATKFRLIHGEEGFPCQKHEVPFVYKYFPFRTPIPMSKFLLDCLHRGGFKPPMETLTSYFSTNNKSPIDITNYDDIISKALHNLKSTGYDLSRSSLIFIDHAILPCKKILCQSINRRYYISDFLLLQDYGSIDHQAYMLGYHISLECDGDELHLQYVQNSRLFCSFQCDDLSATGVDKRIETSV